MLALALPAEGKIIYTPAHVVIPENSYYYIDINHDGIYDFAVFNYSVCDMTSCHPTAPSISNASMRRGFRRPPFNLRSQGVEGHICCTLYALAPGAQISTKRSFLYGAGFGQDWHNHQTRYVGLQFQIKGRTHYGWARFRLDITPTSITVYLTGYAYETVAKKSIIAGRTHDADDAEQTMSLDPAAHPAAPQAATLGLLAYGAPALSIWRRKE
jgi:hypothetical protein